MNQQKKTDKKHWLFPVLILLILLVFVSGILVGVQISQYSAPEQTLDINLSGGTNKTEPSDQTPSQPSGEITGGDETQPFTPQPGMAMDGGSGFASGDALVDITFFKTDYNKNGELVVSSSNGDAVVAPGTTNTRKVRILNTGNCALDYEIIFSDLFANAALAFDVPLEVRVIDYNGKYLIGNSKNWMPLAQLPDVSGTGTIGTGCYVYYTLQWRWPFEGGADADRFDTMLGDLSSELECGIHISATAVQSEDPNAQGGLSTPITGDSFNTSMWMYIAGGSLVMLLFLLLAYPRQRKEEEAA